MGGLREKVIFKLKPKEPKKLVMCVGRVKLFLSPTPHTQLRYVDISANTHPKH